MTTYAEAVKTLRDKGMHKTVQSSFFDCNREYWGFGENDVFLDHSATITLIGHNSYHVSDFSDLRS